MTSLDITDTAKHTEVKALEREVAELRAEKAAHLAGGVSLYVL